MEEQQWPTTSGGLAEVTGGALPAGAAGVAAEKIDGVVIVVSEVMVVVPPGACSSRRGSTSISPVRKSASYSPRFWQNRI